MKNIILFTFVASTMLLQAQNIPVSSSFTFQNPNSILPGRIFGTERETGHHIQDVASYKKDDRASALSSIQILDSLLFWQWDTVSHSWRNLHKISDITYNDFNVIKSYTAYEWIGDWVPSTRYVISFDNNNNITSEVEQTWDGISWENSYKTITVYDINNNLITLAFEVWDGSNWEDNALYSYSYDEYNNLISFVYQSFQGMEWENQNKEIYTFDVHQNQLSHTLQRWNGDAWVNDGQYLYTYDAQNHVTSNLYQIWDGFGWENVIRYLFMYDGSGLLSSELSQYWIGNVWEDFGRFSFTYNAQDQLINQLVETWAANQWINADYYTYTYDANGKELTERREIWNGMQWINSEESSFQYQDTFLISEVFKYYNEGGDAILYGDSSFYYFHQITGTESPEGENINLVVYPNPGNGKVTIRSTLPIASLQIYNSTGQIVHLKNMGIGETATEIDLSQKAKGIYFVKMICGERSFSRAIILQ